MKRYFAKFSESELSKNKNFWDTIKPFMTNKNGSKGNVIMIEKEGVFVKDDKEIVTMFNEYFVNIVEISSCTKPEKAFNKDFANEDDLINDIIKKSETHPSVVKIKSENRESINLFSFQQIDIKETEKYLTT